MTSSSLYLEVEHCHAVCAELRNQITKLKTERAELAKEVDEANERAGELAAKLERSETQRDTLNKALKTVANCNSFCSVSDLRQYASGFVEKAVRDDA